MDEAHLHQLTQAVEDFEFDDHGSLLPFAARLARENGWSDDYASQVIHEYRRFAVLAVVSGHLVVPSVDVDKAWHLHLTYTHSYKQRFCEEVLGQYLHHHPSSGSATEQAGFFEHYLKTLASYERIFGEPPPRSIWPPASQRFACPDTRLWSSRLNRWVESQLTFATKYSSTLSTFALAALLLMLAGCIPQAIENLDFLDFRNHRFLAIYANLLILLIACAGLARFFYSGRSSPTEPIDLQMFDDLYYVAALAQGPRGVCFTAIAKLLAQGNLCIEDQAQKPLLGVIKLSKYVLIRGERLPDTAPEIEQSIYSVADYVADQGANILVEAGLPFAKQYRQQLRDLNLLEQEVSLDRRYRLVPGAMLFGLFGLGLIQFFLNLVAGREVWQLFFLLTATLLAAGYLLFFERYRTPAGWKTLRRLERNNSLERWYWPRTARLPLSDAAAATAYYGPIYWQDHRGILGKLHSLLANSGAFSNLGDPAGDACAAKCYRKEASGD